MVRQALVALLELEDDITVVAQAASGDEAIAMASRYQPDVAAAGHRDAGPGRARGRAQADGRRRSAGKIVIVTTFGRPGYLARRDGGRARAGSCSRTPRPPSWPTAIRRVHAGERVVDPALAAAALAEGASPLTAAGDRGAVRRARACVHLGPGGLLHLSQGTVRNHLSAAIQKLGARNRAEAVQIAERKGWL